MISEHAIIDPRAKIADGVEIGPWTYIGSDVVIGPGTKVASHVVIKGPTTIGRDNNIFQFSSIGEQCQDLKFRGEVTTLEIGDRNTIRECCTFNRGTAGGGGVTRVGSDNLFMAYVHIAHDCIVGDHNIFANNASLAGHVIVENHVGLGGFSAVHQFCRIGSHSFVAKAMVSKDVLPYVMVSGPEVKACGLNSVGLKRRGFSDECIQTLQQAYKIIYRQNNTVEEALKLLLPLVKQSPEVQAMIDGLQLSTRGIVR